MILNLYSYNGNVFSTNYSAYVLHPKPLGLSASANFLEVADTHPGYTGKSFGGGFLTILVKYEGDYADVHLREAEIKRWFNTLDSTPYELIAKDSSDSNRQWYAMATPLTITQENNSCVIVLALETPFWHVKTQSTDSWAIAASTSTKNVTCIGDEADLKLSIQPTSAKSVGFLYYRFVDITNPSTTKTLFNYPINLGALDTAALVSGGKVQSDGDDFRLIVNGITSPRWFGSSTKAFNTATTNIWAVLTLKPGIVLTLGANIAASGDITEITFESTTANTTALTSLPATGILRITTSGNTEYFTYTAKSVENLKVTGVTRAEKLSSEAAHTAGDNVYWIQNDIWIMYGNPSAKAATYSDARKPMFDLDLSTNTSWVYTQFVETGKTRAGAWSKSLLASTLKSSSPYTGSHGASANPATEAGLMMKTAAVNGVEKAETASLIWSLNCPAGITHIASMTGARYRYSGNWPTAAVNKSIDGKTYETAQAITTPTAVKTWGTWTITALSLGGTYYFLQLSQSGTLNALASNSAYVEAQGGTFTLDSNNVPVVSVKSENSTYYLETKITNNTTGEWIYVTFPMKLNETIIVDCAARTVRYKGTNALAALTLGSDRVDWMKLKNGVNQLAWSDTGTLGVTVSLSWRDRVAA